MSVLHRVVRRLTDLGGDGGRGAGPGSSRRRSALAAAATVAVLCGLAACGVQPTGVHATAGGPITLDSSSPTSASAAAGAGGFTFFLFLYRGNSTSSVTPVMRTADHDLTPIELVDALGQVNEDEISDGYATSVPAALSKHLSQTRQLHQYQSTEELNTAAVTQMVCTLDLYWSLHPDPNPQIQDSTEIISPGIYPQWDDCSQQPGFLEAVSKAQNGLIAQSGFEGAAPVPTDAGVPTAGLPEKLKVEPKATTSP